jgi:hypothetical protein
MGSTFLAVIVSIAWLFALGFFIGLGWKKATT